MSKHRRLDRLTRDLAARDEARRPFVAPEVRALADELGVYLGPDDELRELYRTACFDQPTDEELRELADELGVDLDDGRG